MRACSGDFERALCKQLTLDLRKIGDEPRSIALALRLGLYGQQRLFAVEEPLELNDVADGVNVDPVHHSRFLCVLRRYDDPFQTRFARLYDHRQHAVNAP